MGRVVASYRADVDFQRKAGEDGWRPPRMDQLRLAGPQRRQTRLRETRQPLGRRNEASGAKLGDALVERIDRPQRRRRPREINAAWHVEPKGIIADQALGRQCRADSIEVKYQDFPPLLYQRRSPDQQRGQPEQI